MAQRVEPSADDGRRTIDDGGKDTGPATPSSIVHRPSSGPPTPASAAYVGAQRVARLATADREGRPYVVPVCYAFDGRRFYIALDDKPKTVSPRRLKRGRNILDNPQVSLLIDTYHEDWSRLTHVLITATATLIEPGSPDHARAI